MLISLISECRFHFFYKKLYAKSNLTILSQVNFFLNIMLKLFLTCLFHVANPSLTI